MGDFLVQNEDTFLQSKAVLDKVTNATLVLRVAGNSFAILGAGDMRKQFMPLDEKNEHRQMALEFFRGN